MRFFQQILPDGGCFRRAFPEFQSWLICKYNYAVMALANSRLELIPCLPGLYGNWGVGTVRCFFKFKHDCA